MPFLPSQVRDKNKQKPGRSGVSEQLDKEIVNKVTEKLSYGNLL